MTPTEIQKRKDALDEKYFVDKYYCQKDEDCVIRRGVCGKEPLNRYYDEEKILAEMTMVRCATMIRAYENPRCEENKCVADKAREQKRGLWKEDSENSISVLLLDGRVVIVTPDLNKMKEMKVYDERVDILESFKKDVVRSILSRTWEDPEIDINQIVFYSRWPAISFIIGDFAEVVVKKSAKETKRWLMKTEMGKKIGDPCLVHEECSLNDCYSSDRGYKPYCYHDFCSCVCYRCK